jgi:hypothetical protein
MRNKIILGVGLTLGAALVVIASAMELPGPKEAKLIRILSGQKVVAEVRVLQPENITIDAGGTGIYVDPELGNVCDYHDGVKLEVSVAGKPLLKLSAERLQISRLPIQKGAAQ